MDLIIGWSFCVVSPKELVSQLVVFPYCLGRAYSGQNQSIGLPYLALQVPVERDSLLGSPNSTYGTVNNSGQKSNATIRLLNLSYRNIFMSIICYSTFFLLVGYGLSDLINSRRRLMWDKEENSRAIARESWAVEVQKHEDLRIKMQGERVAMDEIRRSWARERAEERKEREQKEKREREEETRKRSNLLWTELTTRGCVRYGVRRYTAALSRVPLGLDSVEECWNKTINIHGREWIPAHCEDPVRKKISKIRSRC